MVMQYFGQMLQLVTNPNGELHQVKALMDSQQLQREKSDATKGTVSHSLGSSAVDHSIQRSVSTESSVFSSEASTMMYKIPRF